jgi:hypothetical protein
MRNDLELRHVYGEVRDLQGNLIYFVELSLLGQLSAANIAFEICA